MKRAHVNFSKSVLILIMFLVFLLITGFSDQESLKYKLVFEGKEKTISCIKDDKGILLVPLNETSNIIGYMAKTCEECNLDEVYDLKEMKAHEENEFTTKRKIYINWSENIATFDIDGRVVTLDANNERVDGCTYTSLQLYEYMGFMIDLDEANKIIRISVKNNETKNNASVDKNESVSLASKTNTDSNTKETVNVPKNKSSVAIPSKSNTIASDNLEQTDKFEFTEVIYAFDQNCTSCKETTSILEDYKQKYNINVTNIDAVSESNTGKLESYYEKCSVPADLRNIFPILFVGDQYLFFKEITTPNIEKILRGEVVNHLLEIEPDEVSGSLKSDMMDKRNVIEKRLILYFYSPTCASCRKADAFINKIGNKYSDLDIKRYSISDLQNMKLLKRYGKYYKLSVADIGNIPALFISDSALVGDEQILENLDRAIDAYDQAQPTPLLDVESSETEIEDSNNTIKFTTVLGAGLVNGINPCSLSMFLFLLSLIVVERKRLLKIGIAFCVGKFLMFFMLGTIFYKLLSFININWMNIFVKTILILIIIAFVVLNISDLIAAKMEKYNRIILQLPSSVRGIYHGLMKKIARYSENRYAIFIMAMLGMLLALGEFICTGQIYLTSIVLLIQSHSQGIIPILYLMLYSFAFIIPLLIVTIFVYFGKKVFNLSDTLLSKLPVIKGISAFLFLIFGLYIIFFT